MDESQFQHLATVLTCITDVSINWGEVATMRGINRKDNAATSFKSMMKKLGVEYANNKFKLIDSPGAGSGEDKPDTPAKVAKPETKKKTATPRKRKPQVSAEDGDENKTEPASPSPTKKRKAKKDNNVAKEDVKEEEEAAEEV